MTLRIKTTALPNAIVGQPYSFFLEAEGGDGNYTWRIVGIMPLKTLLENDARYDAAVVSGNNGECLRLLREIKVGSTKVWNDIPIADFLDALGTFPLPAVAETRLQTIIANGGVVPTSRAGVRSWLQANVTDPAIITALRNLAEREQTWAEDAGAGTPNLNDVRTVVRTIAKSFIVSTGQA